MSKEQIIKFADKFACHLMDEALISEREVVESKLIRALMKGFADVSSKKITEKDARHTPAKEAGEVEMRGSRPATPVKGKKTL